MREDNGGEPGDGVAARPCGLRVGTYWRDIASIHTVEKVSPKGYVTLTNGKRYSPEGKEIGARFNPTYLCTEEMAQQLIDKKEQIESEKQLRRLEYLDSPIGKRETLINRTVKAVVDTLETEGYFSDEDGYRDVLESEIEQSLRSYLNNVNLIKSNQN